MHVATTDSEAVTSQVLKSLAIGPVRTTMRQRHGSLRNNNNNNNNNNNKFHVGRRQLSRFSCLFGSTSMKIETCRAPDMKRVGSASPTTYLSVTTRHETHQVSTCRVAPPHMSCSTSTCRVAPASCRVSTCRVGPHVMSTHVVSGLMSDLLLSCRTSCLPCKTDAHVVSGLMSALHKL